MSEHLRDQWRKVAASFGGATLWHVTDRRDFTIDPEHQPGGGNGEVGIFGAGLFVTPNPELWHYLWRPMSSSGIYAAEIEAPASVVQTVGGPGDDRDQGFIGPSGLDQVTVKRVVPIEQAETEASLAGYGFAMIAADAIERTRICVIDHEAGWGNPMALCERVTDGNPIKWTTVAWVKRGPLTDRICPDCLGVLG